MVSFDVFRAGQETCKRKMSEIIRLMHEVLHVAYGSFHSLRGGTLINPRVLSNPYG